MLYLLWISRRCFLLPVCSCGLSFWNSSFITSATLTSRTPLTTDHHSPRTPSPIKVPVLPSLLLLICLVISCTSDFIWREALLKEIINLQLHPVFFSVTERSDPHHGCSEFSGFFRVHQPQRNSNGSAAGEHLFHRTRRPGAGNTGVRALPTAATTSRSHCASPADRFPTTFRTTGHLGAPPPRATDVFR